MSRINKEYDEFLHNLANLPMTFKYKGIHYKGFSADSFTEISRTTETSEKKSVTVIKLKCDDILDITVECTVYPEYNAYDYVAYFTNNSDKNSGIISDVIAADMTIEGKKPHLKGILGDINSDYAAYDKDLIKENISFINITGRPSHTTFPYFNIETENGGAMLAIGWSGSWKADFVFDPVSSSTHFIGTGTVDFNAYLKPGECMQTARIGVVRYYQRDEDIATNAWRRWIIDCVYPRNAAGSSECAQPFSTVYHCFDTDNEARFDTDGSTAEDYRYWQKSVFSAYEHNLIYDVQWFDAGWYFDPYGNTVEKDWWGTVGTWELDKVKWPDNTFKERVECAHKHGQKFMVWFEPERVTNVNALVANYGYDSSWAIQLCEEDKRILNNLGNKECLAWTIGKILKFFEDYNVDLYREDLNFDTGEFWRAADEREGLGRKGITENLYIQGHLALFDAILDWAAKHNKPTFLDSCASGGGRNDLETLRRAIHINRSDSDRFQTVYRLSLTPRVCKWLPYNGTVAKDAKTLTDNFCDMYALRASYMCVYEPVANFYLDNATIDWDMYKKGNIEFKEISKYLLKDFYVLTEDHSTTDDTKWTAYMFFDPKSDSGVLQAFRQTLCEQETVTLNIKGVDPDKYYTLRDLDKKYSAVKVKGSDLAAGLTLTAEKARTAMVIYIEPHKE